MGLKDEIDEIEKKLKQEGTEDEDENTSGTETDGDGSEEEGSDGDTSGREEGKQELAEDGGQAGDREAQEGEEDKESVDEKPKTKQEFARKSFEERELKRKIAELQSKLDEATKPKEQPKEVDPEPDKAQKPQEWSEWKIRSLEKKLNEVADVSTSMRKEKEMRDVYQNAAQEFVSLEKNYVKENPDYIEAMQYARGEYARGIKALAISRGQSLTEEQINAAIDQEILQYASRCANEGLNPHEELFNMAVDKFGWEKPKQEDVKQASKKPDLKVISSNKKRSASSLEGGRSGSSIPLTKDSIANMSLAEMKELTPKELEELERMA